MARPRAACGTYTAYKRHLRDQEPIDDACRQAQKTHDATRSTSAPARVAKAAGKPPPAAPAPPPPLQPTPTTEDGHVSRLEVLKELLEEQRLLIPMLRVSNPERAYLLMREQRETLREIAGLQGNGQVKGVTLADQLAQARAARNAAAEAS